MKCPNCGKEMTKTSGIGRGIDFSGTAEDYEMEFYWEKYQCKDCKISYDGSNWTVPKAKLPSEKQKNTVLFINNRLHLDLEAITKYQCWRVINKYFEKAKQTPLYSSEQYEEMQEYMDFSEADFC